MNWRVILIAIIVTGVVGFVFFQDETLALIGQEKEIGFSIGGGSETEFTATFSVVRFNGKPVSIQPVVGREKVMHFQKISEEQLKEVMGVEDYFENKGLIRQYKSPAVPMTIPSRGNFTHRLEKCEIIPPDK